MRRTEELFNTHAQVATYLAAALEVIEHGKVPDDLRSVAFAQVYQSVSAKQVFFEQPQVMNLPPNLLGNGR